MLVLRCLTRLILTSKYFFIQADWFIFNSDHIVPAHSHTAKHRCLAVFKLRFATNCETISVHPARIQSLNPTLAFSSHAFRRGNNSESTTTSLHRLLMQRQYRVEECSTGSSNAVFKIRAYHQPILHILNTCILIRLV